MAAQAVRSQASVVLVVDDEERVCHLTARILAETGFPVVEAHSGHEALALLGALNGTVQLVLADIRMPGMSGVELEGIIAREYPSTPVLLMSGQGGPLAGYAGPFLPKPFTAEQVIEAIGGMVPLPKH